MVRLKDRYDNDIRLAMMKKFGRKNIMEVPRLEKIVINIGVGEAIGNAKMLEAAIKDRTAIACQKPIITRARKSISNFKLRAGMAIGTCVTLRRARMYEFLDRFISVAVPRIRDFRGLNPNGFDGRGSYSLGLNEQIIFPEIDYDKVEKVRGMSITFVTTAKTDDEAHELLRLFGMPFRKTGSDAGSAAA